MSKFKDLTGLRFGRLVALEVVSISPTKWKCICDCGKIKVIYLMNLTRGNTQSCGCYRKEHLSSIRMKESGHSGLTILKGKYKRRAKTSSLEFSLTDDELLRLFKDNCYYCGNIPKNISKDLDPSLSKKARQNSEFIYNGIDRVDNSKGYIKENVVTCCEYCNRMKLNYSQEEFYNQIRKIYERFK